MNQFTLPTDKGAIFSIEDWRGITESLKSLQSSLNSLYRQSDSVPVILSGVAIDGPEATGVIDEWHVSSGICYFSGEIVVVDAQVIEGVTGNDLYANIVTVNGAGEPHQLHDGSGFSGSAVIKTIKKLVFTNDNTDDFWWFDIAANRNTAEEVAQLRADLTVLQPTPWVTATLLNGWALSDVEDPIRFRKVGDVVQIIGGILLSASSTSTVAFQLPEGFRPNKSTKLASISATTPLVTIGTNGNVIHFQENFSFGFAQFPLVR
jgi:hypothetical protein